MNYSSEKLAQVFHVYPTLIALSISFPSLLLSQFIKFLVQKSVIVQLWGKQVVDKKPVNVAAKKGKDTKAIMRAETKKQTVSSALLCGVISHCQYNTPVA